jgi:hypothetical protein
MGYGQIPDQTRGTTQKTNRRPRLAPGRVLRIERIPKVNIETRLKRLELAAGLSERREPIQVVRRVSQSEEEVMGELEAGGRITRADRDRVQFIVIETWRDRRSQRKADAFR